MKRFQGTVARQIQFVGVGLHSGSLVNLDVLPQSPDTGILFERTDISSAVPILACPANISSTTLSTTIGKNPNSIGTIEHLMAAFWGLGIDNALVRVSAGEIPILDGSAAPFVDKFSEAGLQIQHVPKTVISIPESFEVVDGDKFIRYEPPQDPQKLFLDIVCTVDFPSSAIGRQFLEFRYTEEEFLKICEARTFCHLDSVRIMRSQGLALGGSLDNAVVVDNERVLNTDGLRFPDEFVRHKILDFFGDIALLPGTLAGKVTLCKNGHGLHAKFTQKIMSYVEKSAPKTNSLSKRLRSAIS
jgi:UDP-3-O-[3-hydroxymyristoyl] N-acetylglucosamine deacetylase